LPDIYLKMLDRIANLKESLVDGGEKIEFDVDLLNQLTANTKYSFERFLTRKDQEQPPGGPQNQGQGARELPAAPHPALQVLPVPAATG